MTDLVIVHLYPRLLRTYGDRGNVLALARRAEWRGFDVRVEDVDLGEPLPADANLVLLGGGTDRVQEIIGADLARRQQELADAAAGGTLVVGICGGYQFLGRRYVTPEGHSIEGLGMLDIETVASGRRIIGRVHVRARLWGREFDMVGFENHGGRTSRGPAAAPLASVVRGGGNDGRDGTEGAVQGTVLGTYLHGPAIPVNPEFADAVLARALEKVTGGAPLTPLDDAAERRAHDEALRQISGQGPRRRKRPAA
jgi:lipid II isoglutaminyl synthase (glutamine-hydrolysing)